MHFSAKRGLAIASRLSVCLSVTLVDCDHKRWNSSKIISRLVCPILMDLIIDLHTATSARVRLAGHLSTPFITTSGVRQGCVFCVLAPALFCRAMDFIMEHVSRKVGIQVGQHTFTDIDYADDVALLVDKRKASVPLSFQWMKNLPSSVSASPGPRQRFRISVRDRRHRQ